VGKGGTEKEEGVRLKHIRCAASSSTAETFLTTQPRQAEHSPLGLNKLRFIKLQINVIFNEIFQQSTRIPADPTMTSLLLYMCSYTVYMSGFRCKAVPNS